MKKNIVSILMISLVLLLTLASCSPNNGSTSVRTVRVIGTAKSVAAATRASEQKYVLGSVTEVKVNGVDIKDKLVPVNPSAVQDGQNNVEFKADVEVLDKTTLEASPEKGFVFDEWEVLDDENNAAVDPKLLDRIEDWLEDNNLENKEKIDNVPSEYIPYLVAEYDRGYYVDLSLTESVGDGSKANPYSVGDFKAVQHNEDELTLVLVRQDANGNFDALIKHINTLSGLEELKIKSEAGVEVAALPTLDKLEEIKLSGFTFTEAITLAGANEESEYDFDNCIFKDLTINGGEVEINGGTADNITILAGEVEIENMDIANTLDLSQMKNGSVELENVTCKYYKEGIGIEVEGTPVIKK